MIKSKALKLEMPKIRLDQRLTLRERVFFVMALLGLLLLFINMIWTPQSAVVAERKARIEEVEQQAESLRSLIDATKQQLVMEQSIPKDETKLDERTQKMLERKVIDPLSEIHTTVSMLSNRRFTQGVKVDDIDIGELVEHDTYSAVPIQIHMRARFGSIQGFITAAKNMNRPVVVKKFNMSRSSSEGGMIEVSIDMELYIPKN